MALQEEIAEKAAEIKTDSYPMSIGELISIYKEGELDVHPEFQRIYRWTNTQKTRLIESILLGIPLPPVFVAQREDGVWDVVDGVQRLSTIFQFVGVLRDEDKALVEPLVLERTDYLPSLKDKRWHDASGAENSFSIAQQLYLKRAKLDINIVLKESDEQSKYELFMRLNTGGTPLSNQEVRNCLLVMINKDVYKWLNDLSGDPIFILCVALSDRAMNEKYHMELAFRFVTFRQLPESDLRGIGDIGEFLNKQISVITQYDANQKRMEELAFRETFARLYSAIEDDVFRKFDDSKQRFTGAFSISAFETIALGIGYHFDAVHKLDQVTDIARKVKSIWTNPEFTSHSGSGFRASQRLPHTVPLGRNLFQP